MTTVPAVYQDGMWTCRLDDEYYSRHQPDYMPVDCYNIKRVPFRDHAMMRVGLLQRTCGHGNVAVGAVSVRPSDLVVPCCAVHRFCLVVSPSCACPGSTGGHGPGVRWTRGLSAQASAYAEALWSQTLGRTGRETHANEGMVDSVPVFRRDLFCEPCKCSCLFAPGIALSVTDARGVDCSSC